jgi:hypothetical protein
MWTLVPFIQNYVNDSRLFVVIEPQSPPEDCEVFAPTPCTSLQDLMQLASRRLQRTSSAAILSLEDPVDTLAGMSLLQRMLKQDGVLLLRAKTNLFNRPLLWEVAVTLNLQPIHETQYKGWSWYVLRYSPRTTIHNAWTRQ